MLRILYRISLKLFATIDGTVPSSWVFSGYSTEYDKSYSDGYSPFQEDSPSARSCTSLCLDQCNQWFRFCNRTNERTATSGFTYEEKYDGG
ncbi:hypothetical protein PoB_000027000 [Plakobranchus ocellatus]|uniref:Secreted protein n=1 Tax=Plakobranchus ocellatus TaxID=259542 RepID=A0AAV3XTE4_9GAST|nr:hypothetical protein PoB_000027000 [Plakobranchus ocellatus]